MSENFVSLILMDFIFVARQNGPRLAKTAADPVVNKAFRPDSVVEFHVRADNGKGGNSS